MLYASVAKQYLVFEWCFACLIRVLPPRTIEASHLCEVLQWNKWYTTNPVFNFNVIHRHRIVWIPPLSLAAAQLIPLFVREKRN
jgi:hypothetical protein